MNWKKRYDIPVEGDKFICITPVNPTHKPEIGGGSGWEEGRIFELNYRDNTEPVKILWPIGGSGGIYEEWARKI